MSATTVDRTTGEIITLPAAHPDDRLPVEDLTGSALERAMRDEVTTEYGRLRDRYGIEEATALKMAVANVKAAASAIADSERQLIEDGGYRQARLDGDR